MKALTGEMICWIFVWYSRMCSLQCHQAMAGSHRYSGVFAPNNTTCLSPQKMQTCTPKRYQRYRSSLCRQLRWVTQREREREKWLTEMKRTESEPLRCQPCVIPVTDIRTEKKKTARSPELALERTNLQEIRVPCLLNIFFHCCVR